MRISMAYWCMRSHAHCYSLTHQSGPMQIRYSLNLAPCQLAYLPLYFSIFSIFYYFIQECRKWQNEVHIRFHWGMLVMMWRNCFNTLIGTGRLREWWSTWRWLRRCWLRRIVRVWGKVEMRFRDFSSARMRSELIFLRRVVRRDGSLLRWFANSQATSLNWCPSEPCCFSISWPVVCLLWGRASIIDSKQQSMVNFMFYIFVCVCVWFLFSDFPP